MRNLFLGLGKVNSALAEVVQGEKVGFVEERGFVIVSRGLKDGSFETINRIAGSFDDFDWKTYLPAQVFISPGIDPRRKFFKSVQDCEICELTYFTSRFGERIIAVTGTDGKSTFTTHLGEVLKRLLPDKKIFVGGNLGSAMALALKEPYEYAVIEVSSFQAERVSSARLDAAIILNLDTDHLDRYDSLVEYHQAKWNLLKFATLIAYPKDVEAPNSLQPSAITFTNAEPLATILKSFVSKISDEWNIPLRSDIFENLPSLPHRFEKYSDAEGRVFINDSKATTLHAALYGLRLAQKGYKSVALVVGGHYKGDDFGKLVAELRSTDQVFIYGEAGEIIEEQMKKWAKKERFATLNEFLSQRLSERAPGSCLLLSPACSSYDEFKNFEERGRFFISRVSEMYKINKI